MPLSTSRPVLNHSQELMPRTFSKCGLPLVLMSMFLLAGSTAWGQLAAWDFSTVPIMGDNGYGPSPYSATTIDMSGIVSASLVRGTGVLTSGSALGNAWGGNGFDLGGGGSLSTAIADGNYVTLSITPAASYKLSLFDIAPYQVNRTGSGPMTGQWQYKVGNGSYTDIGPTITWANGDNAGASIDLSVESALQNVPSGTTVTFRIVIWGTTNSSGSWFLKNFQPGNDLIVNGTLELCSNPPTAGGATTAITCPGSSVNIDGSPSGGAMSYSHEWTNLGTGSATGVVLTNASAQIVTVSAATSGTINLQYKVIDGDACAGTKLVTVTVNPAPTGTLTETDASGNTPNDSRICAGGSATFTASAGFSTYDFKVSGVSVQTGGANIYTTSTLSSFDDVEVEVTDADGCKATFTTPSIIVYPLPSSLSLVADDNSVCAGTNVTLTATAGYSNYEFINNVPVQNGPSNTYSSGILSNGNQINVNVTNINGCTVAVGTVVMTVYALPTPTFTASAGASTCASTDVTYTTETGQTNYIWTVPGVLNTDYTITAGDIGIGSHTVTLQWLTPGSKTVTVNYTDTNGCIGAAASNTTMVNALPVVTWATTLTNQCVSSTTYTLTGGMPGGMGGVYSGAGVTGTNFDASVAGTGPHTLTYTYTDGNGCVNSTTNTITVNALPVVTWGTTLTNQCITSTTYTLTGGMPSGVGGVYSGTGVTGTNFDASVAGVGPHTLTYTYTDGNGCVNTATNTITVNALPVVTWATTLTNQCVSSTTYTLTGGSPGGAGGVYSGTGVTGTNFDASVAGTGPHTLTYTYTDGNGCVNSTTNTITVNALPVVTWGTTLTNQCITSTTYTLTGGMPSGVGGVYSGAGVTGTNFDASAAGAGMHTLTYTYTDINGCINSATNTIMVNALPVVTWGTTLTNQCITSTTYTLTGGMPSGVGGVYSGTGVTGTNFDASVAGVGPHTLTYTYTDGNGCVNSTTNTITVNALPVVTWATTLTNQCVSSTTYTLTGGSPGGAGGVYSGTGVTGTNFDASVAGVGPHTLTYTYTDGNGCVNSTTNTITVNALPVVTWATTLTSQCVSSTTYTLTGGMPGGIGGVYSGAGVTGTNFDASAAGTGPHTLTYTYTDGNGCVNTATNTITVHPLPTVSPITGSNYVYINNTTQLSATPNPPGVWASDNTLRATVDNTGLVTGVSQGAATISYTVTDGNGCTNSATFNVIVNQPIVDIGIFNDVAPSPAGNKLVVKIVPTQTVVNGVYSDGVFTIRCPTSFGVTLTKLASAYGYVQATPTVVNDGGYDYFIFNLTGSYTETWPANTPVTILTLSYSCSKNPVFEIVPAYTHVFPGPVTVDGGYYQELNAGGAQRLIYAPTTTPITLLAITATSDSPACVGESITLSSTPSGGTGGYSAFAWSGPNAYTAAIEDPTSFTASVAAQGAYTVTVTDGNGCMASSTTNVVVPVPAVTATGGSFSHNQPVVLTANAPTAVSYAWSGPNGYAATGNPATPAPASVNSSSGTYTVTVTDATNCTNSASTTVLVYPSTLYVNDNSLTGDANGGAVGDDNNPGTAALPLRTIQKAIDVAVSGDIINVDAGTYVENISVPKSLTINGPNANIDPCTGSRNPEAIVLPAAIALEPTTTGTIFRLGTGAGHIDVSIKGFKIDGSNPALGAGRTLNGVAVHTGAGIVNSIGSFDSNPGGYDVTMTIQNNIIQNLERYGVLADGAAGVAWAGTDVSHNKIDNLPSGNTYGGGRGRGLAFEENHYGTATFNCISRVNVGWQDDNYYLPSPGAGTVVSNNTISSYHRGIFHNLQYQNATNATISNNIISAESSNNSGTDFGVEIASIQSSVGATVTGNNVTGKTYGILLWNCPTTATINVSGGVLTNNTHGIYVTNDDPQFVAASGNSTFVIDGVSIQNSTTNGIWVNDNSTTTVSAQIKNNTLINNTSTGLLIQGGDASASFVGAAPAAFTGQSVYINQVTNGVNVPATPIDATAVSFDTKTGATATLSENFTIEDKIVHKIDNSALGFVLVKMAHDFVTTNSFSTPNTTPNIQRGVDAASPAFTVNVGPGSFNNDVLVNKQLTLLGAGLTMTTVSGPIGGSGSTIQIGASGVIVDGFNVTRDGNNTTDWNNGGLNSAGLSVQSQTNTVEVRNSKFEGNRTGIDVNNSNGNNIHDNIISNNRTGMIFRNQTDNTIVTDNVITNNWTVGIVFLDASGGTNSPVQSAASSMFNNNDLSGNWYGEIVDRQTGGSLPAPGANLKNFECNWYGTNSPVVSTANSAEPGYAAQIPVAYGGSAVAPGGQPDILGPASANFDYISWTVGSPAGACTGTPVTIAINVVTPETCSGGTANGSITTTTTGGTAPYTYAWSNMSTNADATGLVGGTYTVTVTDANGSTATAMATVTALLVANMTTSTNYATVQAAINAASAGNIIQICAGTFNERVVVDKSLTLRGATTNETLYVLNGTGLPGTGSGIVINNGITGVAIKDLTVQNYTGSNGNSHAAIYGTGGNNMLTVDNVALLNNPNASGFYANGPVSTVSVTNSTVTNNGGSARGIVIWNGFKQNITISNNTLTNNTCCGIELQDGTASNVNIIGNVIDVGTGDNAIGLLGLTNGLIQNNTITGGGRFGIEIKNPNGGVMVNGNSVSLTTPNPAELRDRAGIAVFRRDFTSGNPQGYTDIPNGVTITNNNVAGYTQTAPEEGFGIVVEGISHSITGNTVSGSNVGLQLQGGGHANGGYVQNNAGSGDQAVGQSPNYFGRGNAPYICDVVESGNNLGSNTIPRRLVTAAGVVSDPGGMAVINNQLAKEVVLDNGMTQTTYCSIQAAVNASVGNGSETVNVSSGATQTSYSEQVLVNKDVTILGLGATKPLVHFTGTATGKPTLFDVSRPGVTIDNLEMQVDRVKLSSAIIASAVDVDNLTIQNNDIKAVGSSGAASFGPYGNSNAVSVNYGGITNYRAASGGVDNILFQNNTVTGALAANPVSGGVDRFFRAGFCADEAGGTFTGNTVQSINQDIQVRFASNGAVSITNNFLNGGGVDISDNNGGSSNFDISGNTFNGTFANAVVTPRTALLRLKNNQQNKATTISGNTFNNHEWAISLENYRNVSVDDNEFMPLNGSVNFLHIGVNTKSISSNSGAIVQTTVDGSFTNNTFNGSGTTGGTGIGFFNHDSNNAAFGTFTIGSAGNENEFNAQIAEFIRLDNQTGSTNPATNPTDYPDTGDWPTTMACWNQDYDIQNNKFNVGAGLQLPSAMNFMQRAALEAALFHKPDASCAGNLIYFYPVHNLTQNTFYVTIQSAVNAAAVNDVIECSEWTFNEKVTITKKLTLQGVSEANCIIDGTGLGNGSGITINSGVTDVWIKYFTIQNHASGSPNSFAGIYAPSGNSGLKVEHCTIKNNVGGSGFYANGPINGLILNDLDVSGHTGGARGIVVWNGFKENISITNCEVYNNNCCGIELQDGTASGVTMTGNNVHDNADNGIGLLGLNDNTGANVISGNTVANNGRFGIELKNPDGDGVGSIVVQNNTVSFAASVGMNARDHAGISVYRRSFQPGNPNGYPNLPTGVTVQNNNVSGYQQLNPGSTDKGYGIVIEGTRHQVTGNIISNNDVGIQEQGGAHPNANYVADNAGDGDQNAGQSPNYFGRGNAPAACGNTISGSTFSGNAINVNTVTSGSYGLVTNTNTGETFCSIQSAISDAQTLNGHAISVSTGTFIENVIVNKSLTLSGAQAGVDPRATGTAARAGGESIVIPATTDIAEGNLFTVQANNVSIDGFTFNGHNPALAGGDLVNGVQLHTARGISSAPTIGVNNLTVKNNILQNIRRFGVNFYTTNFTLQQGNLVEKNVFDNIHRSDGNAATGVYMENEATADVKNNKMTRTGRGIMTATLGAVTTLPFEFSGNDISTYYTGIWLNNHHSAAPVATATNNTLRTEAGAATNRGMQITSMFVPNSVVVSNNTITSGALDGIRVWSTAAEVTVSNTTITSPTRYGVFIVNNYVNFGDASSDTKLKLSNVDISGGIYGIVAVDTTAAAKPILLTVTDDCEVSGSTATGIRLKGGDVTANIANNDNSISGAPIGIDIDGSTGTVDRNTITTNGIGVRVINGGSLVSATQNYITSNTGDGIRIAANAGVVGNITENDLSGNGGYAINNLSAATLTATCNWYGTVIAGAIAADIFGPVTYSPYSSDATDDQPATPGFQPDPLACNNTPVVINSVVADNVICGETTGSLAVTFSGGTGPYNIAWTGGSATNVTSVYTIMSLPAGSYGITVTDANTSMAVTTASVLSLPVTNVTQTLYYATIQAAINAANPNDVITACAGIYRENIIVNKALDIRGPNYLISPNGGSRVAEAVIQPATSDIDVLEIVHVSASNVSFRGFTIDGDNPTLTSGYLGTNGADLDAAEGVTVYEDNVSNLNVSKNILRNLSYFGITLYGGNAGAAASGHVVTDNLMENFGTYDNASGIALWGGGVLLYNNQYASITNNTLTNMRIGIQTGNYSQANPGAAIYQVIDNNTISARRRGIFHNLHYSAASGFTLSNNNITAVANANETVWDGILLASLSVPSTSQNNTINGSAVSNPTEGYEVWNVNSASPATITGGSVSGVSIGLFVNNYDGYPTAGSDAAFGGHATVSGLSISPLASGTGIRLRDNPLSTHANVQLSIGAGVTITGGTKGLWLENASASIVGATLSNLAFSGQTGNYIELVNNAGNLDATTATFGGLTGATASLVQNFAIEDKIVHKIDDNALGFVLVKANHDFVTANSFVAPATTTPSIQRGVNAASNGFTVNVNTGTYNEQVLVNKSVIVLGTTPKPVVNFTGTPTGRPTLFDITKPNVTIENFQFSPDLSKVGGAIIASDLAGVSNLTIRNNAINPYTTGALLAFGTRNAVNINYGTYRVSSSNPTILAEGNTISYNDNGTPGNTADDIGFRGGFITDEGGGTFNNNTIQTISQDIEARFGGAGNINITGNNINGGGVNLVEYNAGAGLINVTGNTFNGGAGSTYTSALRLKNNYNAKTTNVSGNIFTGHNWGISLENYQAVTIDGNMFTPAANSTTYRHITVNTKEISSSSGFYQPNISATITNNTFNGSGTTGGIGVAFYNHDNDAPVFGTFTIGSAGNENTFAAGIGTFMRLDNSGGPSASAGVGAAGFPEYGGNIAVTTMACWDVDINIEKNKFEITPTFLELPIDMTGAERATLETKLYHLPDNTCMGELIYFRPVTVHAKVFLQGPYNAATDLMGDALRQISVAPLFPTTEPYSQYSTPGAPPAGFYEAFKHENGGGGETINPSLLTVTGPNAIVDWVFLELRNKLDNTVVLATRSALVQRDGDIVDVNGTSSVLFRNSYQDQYYLVVRHRNHLGAMTAAPVDLANDATFTDFSSPALVTFGTTATSARRFLEPGVYGLWAGNLNLKANGTSYQVRYNGGFNDPSEIITRVGALTPLNVVSGYYIEDANLDGVVRDRNQNNDRAVILNNVGATTPNNVITQQPQN